MSLNWWIFGTFLASGRVHLLLTIKEIFLVKLEDGRWWLKVTTHECWLLIMVVAWCMVTFLHLKHSGITHIYGWWPFALKTVKCGSSSPLIALECCDLLALKTLRSSSPPSLMINIQAPHHPSILLVMYRDLSEGVYIVQPWRRGTFVHKHKFTNQSP